jgi:hypothetical protein
MIATQPSWLFDAKNTLEAGVTQNEFARELRLI